MSIQYLQYLHMVKFLNTLNWAPQNTVRLAQLLVGTEENETYGRNKTYKMNYYFFNKMLGLNLKI